MKKEKPGSMVWILLIAILLSGWMPLKGTGQDSLSPQHFFSLLFEDDFLNLAGQGTDRYYTAGINFRYSFLPVSGQKNILRKILYSPYPADASSLFSFSLTQWIYTPDDLSTMRPVNGDYPYCGVLFLGFSRETLSRDRSRLFHSSLSLGTMGPSALGKEVQTTIHSMFKVGKPQGWGNQLPDFPVVNYSLYYEPNLFSISQVLKVNGSAFIQAGSLHTNAELGLDLLISNEKDNFFPDRDAWPDTHNRKRPAFYIQAKPSVRFVGYNSILQGGPFDNRNVYHIPAGQLQRVLFEGAWIMGIRVGDFSIQYRQEIESPEFRTMRKHAYGGFLLQWRLR